MSTGSSHRVAALVAGVGAALVAGWPDLLAWWASASGALGDLDGVEFAGVGIVTALALGVFAAVLMPRALDRGASSPGRTQADAWGAYALGLGVYSLVLVSLGPAVFFWLVLGDENRSLAGRGWLIPALLVLVQAVAAGAAVLAGRAVLGSAKAATRSAG